MLSTGRMNKSLHAVKLCMLFVVRFFNANFHKYHRCQIVWIQIRPCVLLCLVRVQIVCKGYHQGGGGGVVGGRGTIRLTVYGFN